MSTDNNNSVQTMFYKIIRVDRDISLSGVKNESIGYYCIMIAVNYKMCDVFGRNTLTFYMILLLPYEYRIHALSSLTNLSILLHIIIDDCIGRCLVLVCSMAESVSLVAW